MLIVKNPDNQSLRSAARRLRAGAVIVYPTDTAYGLGGDAGNAQAVARIFRIKGRAASKALPLIVADVKMAKKFFVLKAPHLQLAARHWPGPLSIIVKAKKGIVRKILSKGTAAVRVPDSVIARRLSKLSGRPLVATSANLSGQPPCYSVKTFLRQGFGSERGCAKRGLPECKPRAGARASSAASANAIADKPDLIIDAGALPRRKPSTIVRSTKSGIIEVLRKGPIKP